MPDDEADRILRDHLLQEHGIADVGVYTSSLASVHREIHRSIEQLPEESRPPHG